METNNGQRHTIAPDFDLHLQIFVYTQMLQLFLEA